MWYTMYISKTFNKGENMAKPICPVCETSYGMRYRIRNKEFVCLRCGYVGKIPPTQLVEKTKQAIQEEFNKQNNH